MRELWNICKWIRRRTSFLRNKKGKKNKEKKKKMCRAEPTRLSKSRYTCGTGRLFIKFISFIKNIKCFVSFHNLTRGTTPIVFVTRSVIGLVRGVRNRLLTWLRVSFRWAPTEPPQLRKKFKVQIPFWLVVLKSIQFLSLYYQ